MLTPDIVVQDVDAAPAAARLGDRNGECFLVGHVGREGHAFAALFRGHRRGLLGRGDHPVDCQHLGALLCKAQGGRPPVTHTFAGTLPGADDNRDFSFETHGDPLQRRLVPKDIADRSALKASDLAAAAALALRPRPLTPPLGLQLGLMPSGALAGPRFPSLVSFHDTLLWSRPARRLLRSDNRAAYSLPVERAIDERFDSRFDDLVANMASALPKLPKP